MASIQPASTACTSAVSAPSSLISAKANGWSSGCFGVGSVTQPHVSTTPPGPTSTKSRSRASPVSGSHSQGGHSTRPSLDRIPRILPVPQAGQERSHGGPERAGVRELDDVSAFSWLHGRSRTHSISSGQAAATAADGATAQGFLSGRRGGGGRRLEVGGRPRRPRTSRSPSRGARREPDLAQRHWRLRPCESGSRSPIGADEDLVLEARSSRAWQSRTAGSGDDAAVMSAAVRGAPSRPPASPAPEQLHHPVGRGRRRRADAARGARPSRARSRAGTRRGGGPSSEVAVDRAERDLGPAATSRICTASYPPSAARSIAASSTRARRAAWFGVSVSVSTARRRVTCGVVVLLRQVEVRRRAPRRPRCRRGRGRGRRRRLATAGSAP